MLNVNAAPFLPHGSFITQGELEELEAIDQYNAMLCYLDTLEEEEINLQLRSNARATAMMSPSKQPVPKAFRKSSFQPSKYSPGAQKQRKSVRKNRCLFQP